jgi:hypothetical protein
MMMGVVTGGTGATRMTARSESFGVTSRPGQTITR